MGSATSRKIKTHVDTREGTKVVVRDMASKLKVVMFQGSVRENRLGERVAKFMKNYLEKNGNHEVELLDPQTLGIPLLHKPLHFFKDKTEASAVLQECDAKIRSADAYVVISAEYNHSIPPALANLMDHFAGSSYAYKPSAIVCYSPGIYGGMRAAMQLRAFLGELGCLSVSNIFGIPEVHKALDADGNPLNDHMNKGAAKLITQLDWHAHAMKIHRDEFGIPK